jgi:short-subunit dehydrogenase
MNDREGTGRTALITGASAGIGEALARVFAEHGFDVVLTARREERLRAVADDLRAKGTRATYVTADLADPAAPAALCEELVRRGIAVDALVNNAGYGVPGFYRDCRWEEHARFMQVMVTAVLELTHRLEAGMTERRWGRILNVASLAGLVPGTAGHTLYGASKAFMIKWSESLALEHADDGVHVTAVCPGFTYSEFHDVVGTREKVRKLPRFMWMDAETVARQGYRAVMDGVPLCVNGPVNQALATVARLVPERVALSIMKAGSHRFRIRPEGAGGG